MLPRCYAKHLRSVKSLAALPRSHIFHDRSPSKVTEEQRTRNTSSVNDPWNAILANVPAKILAHVPNFSQRGLGLHATYLSSHRHLNHRRGYATSSRDVLETKDSDPESIFSPQQSAWDHVFSDIKETPVSLPAAVRNPLRSPAAARGSDGSTRRHAMTAREISAFDEMFDMIFNAVSEQMVNSDTKTNESDPSLDIGIGRGHKAMGDLFGRLRGHSKRAKWTSESDELLDRKKEEMDLCDTDQQLLEWAMREVFGESQLYEAAWQKNPELPMQPPTYPHLIALLMRAFWDKYQDPHLALAIFDHARHLSIPSYVFGCSTQSYNELIETRWFFFRDLKGVYDALEEMIVNGVELDSRTHKLMETVRREVGQRNLWVEENELGSGEVWKLLTKIEGLVTKPGVKFETSRRSKWDDWKNIAFDDKSDDDWEFGHWEKSMGGRPHERGMSRAMGVRGSR